MKSIQEYAEWYGRNRYNTPFQTLDLRKQLTVLLDVLGKKNMRKDKTNAFTTKKVRAYVAHSIVEVLRAKGYRLKNLLNLDERHVIAVITAWTEQDLSASTVASRISVLRWLAAALGKPGLARDPVHYGFPADLTHRHQVATEDRSWTSRGVDPATVIAAIRTEDQWVAMQLEMCHAFGLRLTEGLLIEPVKSHIGDTLRVDQGTKGGRTRVVPIVSDHQRDVLERAKVLARESERGNLVPRRRMPEQARRHLYYVCGKHRISKSQLGVTPHGLRHQYVNDRYESVSGTPSSVRGGSQILNKAAEEAALRAVTNETGHARLSITSMYLGARKRSVAQAELPSEKAAPNAPPSSPDADPGGSQLP